MKPAPAWNLLATWPRDGRWLGMQLLLAVTLCSGCAVHYYDRKTGTEHLWGFGHMKMKLCPAREGVQATVKGTELAGILVGRDEEGFALAAGWESRHRILVSPTNCNVRLEWPDADFFNVRIGSLPPFGTNSLNPNTCRQQGSKGDHE